MLIDKVKDARKNKEQIKFSKWNPEVTDSDMICNFTTGKLTQKEFEESLLIDDKEIDIEDVDFSLG